MQMWLSPFAQKVALPAAAPSLISFPKEQRMPCCFAFMCTKISFSLERCTWFEPPSVGFRNLPVILLAEDWGFLNGAERDAWFFFHFLTDESKVPSVLMNSHRIEIHTVTWPSVQTYSDVGAKSIILSSLCRRVDFAFWILQSTSVERMGLLKFSSRISWLGWLLFLASSTGLN